jgi:hypothetical protein
MAKPRSQERAQARVLPLTRPSQPYKYPSPHVGDPHADDLDRAPARDHALGSRGGEPGAHEVDHHVDREAVREHDRLGAAVAAGGQQFEGAAASGGRDALARAVAWASTKDIKRCLPEGDARVEQREGDRTRWFRSVPGPVVHAATAAKSSRPPARGRVL